MRGDDQQQAKMFSYIPPEQRVPLDHILRVIRKMVDRAFSRLSPVFEELYCHQGPPFDPSGEAAPGAFASGALNRA